MSLYKNVLVAVECGQSAKLVLSKAANIAKGDDVKISIVHVVLDLIVNDFLSVADQSILPLDHKELAKSGASYLEPMIKEAGLDPNDLVIFFGSPATTIIEQADTLNSDLIIAGSHSRRGLEVLLGSTAHKILNLANSDVLLVHVPKA